MNRARRATGPAARGGRGALRPGAGPQLLLASIVLGAIGLAQTGAATEASWNDAEWVHAATIGTSDCTSPAGQFASRGQGRVLSGAILGVDLDAAVDAAGVTASNDGSRAAVDPASANSAGTDAWANPLNVTALSAAEVDLEDMLQLPLDNSFGALGQYARASSTGASQGAAGFVTNTGAIAAEPGNGYPELATLRLSTLLGALDHDLGALLPGVADAGLEIGAVAGRAELEGCRAVWGENLSSALTREYLTTSLATVVESPTVTALKNELNLIVSELNGVVVGLAGNAGVLSQIGSGLGSLLTGVLGTLNLGSVQVNSLSASINLNEVTALAGVTISDSAGAVSVDLDSGTVRIDTAALLQRAYPGQYGNGLNGLPPNTDPLAEPIVVAALQSALNEALQDWLDDVDDALTAAIDAIALDVRAKIVLRAEICLWPVPCIVQNVAEINVAAVGGLAAIEAGQGVTVSGGVLGGLIPVSLLTPILGALTGTAVGGVIGPAVRGVLPTVGGLLGRLDDLVGPLVAAVSGVYSALYVNGVVSVTINAQNDPLAGGAEPGDWQALPEGRYDVAALRIGVLDALGDADVRLYLGRGSVGVNCSIAQAAVRCPGY